jgi:hypothetical protein
MLITATLPSISQTSECHPCVNQPSTVSTSLFRASPSVLLSAQPCKKRSLRGNSNMYNYPNENVVRPVENQKIGSKDICKILDGALNRRERLLKKRQPCGSTTPTRN